MSNYVMISLGCEWCWYVGIILGLLENPLIFVLFVSLINTKNDYKRQRT